jgi:hypothetical protein
VETPLEAFASGKRGFGFIAAEVGDETANAPELWIIRDRMPKPRAVDGKSRV